MDPSFTDYLQRSRAIDSEGRTERGRKKTKVVATLGPSTDNDEVLDAFYHLGLNVARLNMSHGDRDDQSKRLAMIRRFNEKLNRPVATLVDIQGPKIRLGRFKTDDTVWSEGGRVTITTVEFDAGDAERIGTTYPGLANDVRKGDRILIDDGRIELRVEESDGTDVTCSVVVGGPVSSNKGLNLPGVKVSAPTLTEKDKEDISWAIQNDVDYIALSFVSSAQDVRNVRRRIAECGRDIPIIAKIEREEAVRNIESILVEADGIMVARGDLGIEISTHRLPVVQKHLIQRANAHGKLVITATQMLESMIKNPVPTRAESNDVANAIFDGTDAIMLSGETAVGEHPVEAVHEMLRIAVDAEHSSYMPSSAIDEALIKTDRINLAITSAADHLAESIDAAGVLVFSHGHEKAAILSKRRCHGRTINLCYDDRTWRQLSGFWGTVPLRIDFHEDPYDLVEEGLRACLEQEVLKEGDTVVILMGFGSDAANSLKIVTV